MITIIVGDDLVENYKTENKKSIIYDCSIDQNVSFKIRGYIFRELEKIQIFILDPRKKLFNEIQEFVVDILVDVFIFVDSDNIISDISDSLSEKATIIRKKIYEYEPSIITTIKNIFANKCSLDEIKELITKKTSLSYLIRLCAINTIYLYEDDQVYGIVKNLSKMEKCCFKASTDNIIHGLLSIIPKAKLPLIRVIFPPIKKKKLEDIEIKHELKKETKKEILYKIKIKMRKIKPRKKKRGIFD
jgi:hypothetical protein